MGEASGAFQCGMVSDLRQACVDLFHRPFYHCCASDAIRLATIQGQCHDFADQSGTMMVVIGIPTQELEQAIEPIGLEIGAYIAADLVYATRTVCLWFRSLQSQRNCFFFSFLSVFFKKELPDRHAESDRRSAHAAFHEERAIQIVDAHQEWRAVAVSLAPLLSVRALDSRSVPRVARVDQRTTEPSVEVVVVDRRSRSDARSMPIRCVLVRCKALCSIFVGGVVAWVFRFLLSLSRGVDSCL
jgi:hypothetical protein